MRIGSTLRCRLRDLATLPLLLLLEVASRSGVPLPKLRLESALLLDLLLLVCESLLAGGRPRYGLVELADVLAPTAEGLGFAAVVFLLVGMHVLVPLRWRGVRSLDHGPRSVR